MIVRIITAVVGIAAVIGLVHLGGLALTAAVMVVAALAWLEYARMITKKAYVFSAPALLALFLIIGSAAFSSLPLFAGTVFGCFILLLFLIVLLNLKRLSGLVYTVFGVCYFGIGFGALLFLRGGDALLSARAVSIPAGVFLLWFALIGTWASDSFAYLVGKFFGKHKMAPHISPNKTMEGLAGGAAGCVLLDLGFSAYFGYDLVPALALAVMVAVAAPMGDLFESYVKRVCDVKDSGNILPGHGGMMDRFDSLLFVAPLMLAALLIMK